MCILNVSPALFFALKMINRLISFELPEISPDSHVMSSNPRLLNHVEANIPDLHLDSHLIVTGLESCGTVLVTVPVNVRPFRIPGAGVPSYVHPADTDMAQNDKSVRM